MCGAHKSADKYAQLMLRAQGGDPRAFADIYIELSPTARDFAGSLDRQLSAHDRDDVTQEVFLRVWKGLSRFRGDASVKTLVLAITRNVVMDGIAKRRRLPLLSPAAPASLPARVAAAESAGWNLDDTHDRVLDLRHAMSKLTEAQRQALELDQICQVPRVQAAKLAKCTPSEFAKRLHRAFRSLEVLLRDLPKSSL